uniref:Persuasin 5 n=1 Tax=Ichthyosaura alpestris TaxID=54263 RepID=A0A346M2R2_ICHAP|nr:persuasin 5 [Ichthyosaura alpestris]
MGVFATMFVLFLCSVNAHSSHRKDGLQRRAVDACSCCNQNGGCVITAPPPPNKACNCVHSWWSTCGGQIRDCVEPNAFFSTYPDTSLGTCLQGGGNCLGYSETCDCQYVFRSCKLTRPAIARTACRCIYKGLWVCTGMIVLCRNQYSIYCDKPELSKESCLLVNGKCVY